MASKKTAKKGRKQDSFSKWFLRVCFKLTLAIALFAAIGWGGWSLRDVGKQWLDSTSMGRVQYVEVKGLERLQEPEILSVAQVDSGCSLMYFPFDSVAAMISAIPAVESVRIYRRLPGRLIIEINEREPVAVLGGGNLVLVDENSVLFNPAVTGEVIDLPVITGINSDSPDSKRALQKSVKALTVISSSYPTVYRHLSEVQHRNGEVKLRLCEGGAVVKTLGSVSDDDLGVLEEFLVTVEKRMPSQMEYVDLTFYDKVAAK